MFFLYNHAQTWKLNCISCWLDQPAECNWALRPIEKPWWTAKMEHRKNSVRILNMLFHWMLRTAYIYWDFSQKLFKALEFSQENQTWDERTKWIHFYTIKITYSLPKYKYFENLAKMEYWDCQIKKRPEKMFILNNLL